MSKTSKLARIMASRVRRPVKHLLVVGCGSGREAATLAQELHCEVVGVDIDTRFDAEAATHCQLQFGDARQLNFASESFDYVYSYHALEHIPEHRKALSEMARVLAPGGSFCIGTPNRSRLFGYVGSVGTPLADKIRWNAQDWSMRLRGRFHNEFGAHAGFTAHELSSDLRAAFGVEPENVSLPYYLAVYSHHQRLLQGLHAAHLDAFAFPSVYFVGTTPGAAPRPSP